MRHALYDISASTRHFYGFVPSLLDISMILSYAGALPKKWRAFYLIATERVTLPSFFGSSTVRQKTNSLCRNEI